MQWNFLTSCYKVLLTSKLQLQVSRHWQQYPDLVREEKVEKMWKSPFLDQNDAQKKSSVNQVWNPNKLNQSFGNKSLRGMKKILPCYLLKQKQRKHFLSILHLWQASLTEPPLKTPNIDGRWKSQYWRGTSWEITPAPQRSLKHENNSNLRLKWCMLNYAGNSHTAG